MKPKVGSLWTENTKDPRKWLVTEVTRNNVNYVCTFTGGYTQSDTVPFTTWVKAFDQGRLVPDKETAVQKDLEELLK